ncbi:DNA cytosine methyltransferase [Rhizobium multihospitium]|uniref:DNA (cytosine-5-)-methyltransferase n=1 Tax=Rhizobium multihospitium TaxID=410764 RepID=A0A1C3VSG7_9HYPH|nr:DNA cytosine methyltransferase [Rhizobium multihospitium]SCB30726.1 DNA (cytosine-5)-methyltransferase 1 [Rhizobium multihospitium]
MVASERSELWRSKALRLGTGAAPRVLEICSGCGGLSLGLASAGFELSAHVEIDPEAAASYALNFGGDREPDDPWSRSRDMVDSSADEIVSELKLGTPTGESFDILAAGLPCQAFARIGRSKLRAVAGKEDAFQTDPRAALYRRFLDYVRDTQPLAIIIENVPDILNFGGHNVPEEICSTLDEVGYRTAYTILNAAYFGVPQVRERLFIIAIAETLQVDPLFPDPTHFLDLPRGYESSRRVALKHVDTGSPHFHGVHRPSETLPSAVGVQVALGDLPEIHEHRHAPRAMRRRRLDDMLPYRMPVDRLSDYARLMRHWPGFSTGSASGGHLVRITPRDFPIFEALPHGADYPQARKLAESMFRSAALQKGFSNIDEGSEQWEALWNSIVPPYDPGKFPNKWWKLEPAKPSRTLTAHIGKDTYSHIHYDSGQSRTISVREAARLQSFPDGFRFAGAMNAAFRQVGNAVPPLLGKAVAMALKQQIDSGLKLIDKAAGREAA